MSKTVEKAKQDVAKVQRELDEIAATNEALDAETRAVVARVTADVLAGETPKAEGARLREQATRKRDEVQARRETLQLALPELIIRLEAAEEAERTSMAEKARLRARPAIDNRERALRGFAARARELNSSAREVARHRELVDASVDLLRGLLSRGEELDLSLDEDAWPHLSSLSEAELRAALAGAPGRFTRGAGPTPALGERRAIELPPLDDHDFGGQPQAIHGFSASTCLILTMYPSAAGSCHCPEK